jgi:hypothetical protein
MSCYRLLFYLPRLYSPYQRNSWLLRIHQKPTDSEYCHFPAIDYDFLVGQAALTFQNGACAWGLKVPAMVPEKGRHPPGNPMAWVQRERQADK